MIVGWMDAVEDYLEKCAQIKVKIDLVESLLRPVNIEVSFIRLEARKLQGGSNIFQLFDTAEKPIILLPAEDDGWKVREETMRGRRVGETSGTTLGIKEPRQKLRCAPTALYRLLCLSNARCRPEKKKIMGN